MFSLNTYHRLLDARLMGGSLVILDEVSSTNAWITDRLGEPGIEQTVAVAETQTHGRGRFGRVWISPPRVNLAFSLAWRIPRTLSSPGLVTLAAGVALAGAVSELVDVGPALKYPNDLMVNGAKAGGILTELKGGDGGSYAVIGVGVNVNTTEDQFPEDIKDTATSLKIAAGESVSREALLALFINRLEDILLAFERDGAAPVIDRYKKVTNALGRVVEVVGVDGGLKGTAVDIDADGAMIIETASGHRRAVMSGETRFVY